MVVVTIPIVGLTLLILLLNIVAPSSTDVRVLNFVVPVGAARARRVIEVPVEPNKPVKKGDVLFQLDPVPFQIEVSGCQAQPGSAAGASCSVRRRMPSGLRTSS